MVNHTNYDPDLWDWCPDPSSYTRHRDQGLVIIKEIEQELKGVIGHVPFAGNEFSSSDLAVALSILKIKAK